MPVKKYTPGPVTRFRYTTTAQGATGPAGPPGAGVGTVTGSGFLHNTNSALDSAASHGAVGQILFGGNSDVLWAAPMGDVSLVGETFTVTGLQGHGVSSTAPTSGQFLLYGTQWAATSLTGDVSASVTTPGKLTVTALQGNPVTTNAPATNYVLAWTGSAWNPTSAAALIPPTTWANDLSTSSNTHQYLSSISGGSGTGGAVPLSAGAFLTAASGSNSYIDLTGAAASYGYGKFLNYVQAPAFDTTAAAQLTIGGTNANAIAVGNSTVATYTLATKTGGSATFKADSTFWQSAGGTGILALGTSQFYPTTDLGVAFGLDTNRLASVAAGPTGFNVYHLNTDTKPTSNLGDGILTFGPGGTTTQADTSISRYLGGQVQISNDLNGNATLLVGGTSSANMLSLASSTTTISVAGTGATTGASLTMQSQAGASGNAPGSILANIPAPTGGGAEGFWKMQRGGSSYGAIGAWPTTPTSYAALWLGPGVSPSATNFAFLSDGNLATIFNSPNAAGLIYFQFANSTALLASSSTIYPNTAGGMTAGTAANYFGGVYSSSFQFPAGLGATGFVEWSGSSATPQATAVVGQASSGAAASGSVAIVSGAVGSGVDGGIQIVYGGTSSTDAVSFQGGANSAARGNMQWSSGLTPKLYQASTSAATGANFTISSQASTASPGTPGNIVLNIPAPSGAGSKGYVAVSYNSTTPGLQLSADSFTSGFVAGANNLTLTAAAASALFVGLGTANVAAFQSTALGSSNSITAPFQWSLTSGTNNGQAQKCVREVYLLQTATSTAAQIATINLPNSTGCVVRVIGIMRCTAVGSSSLVVTQSSGFEWTGTFYANASGTVTGVATPRFIWQDSSSNATMSASNSSANTIAISVTAAAGSPTCVWEAVIEVIYN